MGKLSLREVKWRVQSHTDYERQGFQPSLHKASCAVLSCSSIAYLCNPRDCSPPGFSVHGILQVRILEWVAMLSSRGTSQPRAKPWPNWIPVSSTILLRLSSSAIQKVALWHHCLYTSSPKPPPLLDASTLPNHSCPALLSVDLREGRQAEEGHSYPPDPGSEGNRGFLFHNVSLP